MWIVMLTIWILCGFIGGAICDEKNQPYASGFLIGFLLGVIGIAICLLMPKEIKNELTESEESEDDNRTDE